jgi:glycosyltransferase involved in cell wall biosynthesis
VSGPEIAVVVPSHARRLRLRWLLNSLEEQTLERNRFEVVVVHDYDERDTRDTLERHPLANAGVLRHIAIEPGTGQPARQRNLGWRASGAPLVAFVADDCRADPGWLEAYIAAAERAPGAIIQGATKTEPYEYETWAAPHVRTIDIPNPPNEFLQTCNILYPRDLLERLGGFDESLASGEDTELSVRAVEEYTLPAYIRMSWKWRDLVRLVRRHPELRERGEFTLGIFWKKAHWQLLLALIGLALARRLPLLGLLVVPYLNAKLRRRGGAARQVAVALFELPGQAAADAGEIAAMAAGSVEHRSLVL